MEQKLTQEWLLPLIITLWLHRGSEFGKWISQQSNNISSRHQPHFCREFLPNLIFFSWLPNFIPEKRKQNHLRSGLWCMPWPRGTSDLACPPTVRKWPHADHWGSFHFPSPGFNISSSSPYLTDGITTLTLLRNAGCKAVIKYTPINEDAQFWTLKRLRVHFRQNLSDQRVPKGV